MHEYPQTQENQLNQSQVNAKMQAERAYQNQANIGDSCCNAELGNNCAEPKEMAIHRLMRQRRNAEREHERIDRAIGILERHPEFEECIELLRSGLV